MHMCTDIRRRGFSLNEPTDKPWTHDLHHEHENEAKQEQLQSKPIPVMPEAHKERGKSTPTSKAPNRTFSFTAVLGNVNIQVLLPSMVERVIVPNVVKKHHTLLPQHRPPLRRDKPVRVSIPDTAPRYIFPSTDRSFIFIPRALRPNQQAYNPRRGRGSFHGSRRPSIYGSGYTPSVAMSRKSSIGASTMREGIRSPTDSVVSRQIGSGIEANRPLVRMPSTSPGPAIMQAGMPMMNGVVPFNGLPPPQMHPAAMYGSHSMAIPMHQPRPQKAVSVAGIESPASFQFKAPQQQQEQPFHQQVPVHIAHSQAEDNAATQPIPPMGTGMAGATPLSQIPEGAAFAPGFQPQVMGGPPYFGASHHNGAVFYPPIPDASQFGFPMGGPAMAPSFVPGSQTHPVNYMAFPGPVAGGMAGNMMAHETNGMVYYYNPEMYANEPQQQFAMVPNGNTMPMVNGVPTQAPYYYPHVPAGMFYPTQTG